MLLKWLIGNVTEDLQAFLFLMFVNFFSVCIPRVILFDFMAEKVGRNEIAAAWWRCRGSGEGRLHNAASWSFPEMGDFFRCLLPSLWGTNGSLLPHCTLSPAGYAATRSEFSLGCPSVSVQSWPLVLHPTANFTLPFFIRQNTLPFTRVFHMVLHPAGAKYRTCLAGEGGPFDQNWRAGLSVVE